MSLHRSSILTLLAGWLVLTLNLAAAEPLALRAVGSLISQQPPFRAQIEVDQPDRAYQEGQTVTLEARAQRDAYLYVLYHSHLGGTVLLFPNAARPDNRAPAGQVVRIPGPGEAFRFRVKAPSAGGVFQVLAATQVLPPLHALCQPGRGPVVSLEVINEMAVAIRQYPWLWGEHRVGIRIAPGTPAMAERPTARVGLFIGIGKYWDENRSGCVAHPELRKSAERMHQLMLDRGQLDPARTRLVVDEQADRASLERLVTEWLPSVSQPGDTVFLYFSGHSGRIENQDGTEPDGEDELLCPYDQDGATLGGKAGLARIRATAILDDTLADWLKKLSGRQVVLILDTCHSGGVVQELGLAHFLEEERTRPRDVAGMNLVVLTSCASDEQSLIEGSPSKTMWFTHFLTERMMHTKGHLTAQAALEGCRADFHRLLRGRREIQQPTCQDSALLPIPLIP